MRPKKVGKVPRPSCSCGPFSRETRGVKFRETMASEAAAARARDLHASISRLLELPARTLILPGHVSEPIPFRRSAAWIAVRRDPERRAAYATRLRGFRRGGSGTNPAPSSQPFQNPQARRAREGARRYK